MSTPDSADYDVEREPEFWTPEDLRTLAEHLEWLEAGPIKEAVVCLEVNEQPVAWVWVHPSNGPHAQVTFDPTFPALRATVTAPAEQQGEQP